MNECMPLLIIYKNISFSEKIYLKMALVCDEKRFDNFLRKDLAFDLKGLKQR